ncbi:MAG: ATP-binding cassette domain-containing protein, partial [Acidimicrobiales bacterium]|nr:ATP-binding cassette domain-containing protein [Acidimicrobiales bacterium]
MRALLETLAALRGTIVVGLRRSRRRTVVLGSVAVAVAVAGLVVILGGTGGGGSDDVADGGGSSRSGAVTDEGEPDAADPDTDVADGRPLIDGVAKRPTGDADPGGDADGGTAEVNGFDVVTQATDVRESISLTGQFAAVDEILTGRENLVLIARLRHLDRPDRLADDLLARFSLTDAGGRRVATYSGGMRRRLDIAMSLIGSPPVIFLDEPTTGLDPQARLEVWQSVRDLAHGGTTVLLTTQHLDEAEQLADRIAILHEGRILVDGTLGELKALMPPAQVEYV